MINQPQPFDLLRETVGKPLKKAMADLGCPDLPHGLLTTEHREFLDAKLDNLPEDMGELERLVLKNAVDGKVIRVGHTPDGKSLFSVRFRLQNAACVITFAYCREEWTIHQIEAIQTRAFQINRLLLGGLIGSAVSFMIAFLLWNTSGDDIVAKAKEAGYVVLTEEEYRQKVGDAALAAASTGQNSAPNTNEKTNPSTANQADSNETVAFTLQQGMTVNDLTTFLKNEGLIQDQAAFNQKLTQQGIDTKLQPRTYNFRKGMSEQELMEVLKG
jgi:hypothetical protein